MAIMAVKRCEWVDGLTDGQAEGRTDRRITKVILLISGGELRAAPSAPALGEGNV